MTPTVLDWWSMLRGLAVLNIVAWTASAALLLRQRSRHPAAAYRKRRLLLWLSGAYVAGCAFRSLLPRIDLERICLVDSWFSNMVVGRSVATVAELCFIAQFVLLLHSASRQSKAEWPAIVALLLLPLTVVAECASWYAILSTNYLGHFIENSIWTLCVALFASSLPFLWRRGDPSRSRFLAAMMIFSVVYIFFMTSVDLPMYWSRWSGQLAGGAAYLSLPRGFADAAAPCLVSFDWKVWREEIPWQSLYFTLAVWVSISLPHVSGPMFPGARTDDSALPGRETASQPSGQPQQGLAHPDDAALPQRAAQFESRGGKDNDG